MHERARRLRSIASGIFLCLSMAATDLAAAPNEPVRPRAPSDDVPLALPPAAGSANWPTQVLDRIIQNTKFPANGYCREGTVNLLFLIDRAGKLLSSEVTESSNVPAFDAEALAILKRAHPFPPPPQEVGGGAFVSLRIPIRFIQTSEGASSERRVYLNLKSDSTLTLDGAPLQANGLDRTINSVTNNDKNVRIIICNDENVPPEQVSNLAEQVKAAGFKFTVAPRPDPDSD